MTNELVKLNLQATLHLMAGMRKLHELKDLYVSECEKRCNKDIEHLEQHDITTDPMLESLNRHQKKQRLKKLEDTRNAAIRKIKSIRNKSIGKWDKGVLNIINATEVIYSFLNENRTNHLEYELQQGDILEELTDEMEKIVDQVMKGIKFEQQNEEEE